MLIRSDEIQNFYFEKLEDLHTQIALILVKYLFIFYFSILYSTKIKQKYVILTPYQKSHNCNP